MPQHVFEATVGPTAAPTQVGQHWINTTNGDHYISVGTAAVSDWVRTIPYPTGAGFRVKLATGEFQLYNPNTVRYHTVYLLGTEASPYLVFGPAEV